MTVVTPIESEPTVFSVASRTLQCPNCSRHVKETEEVQVASPCSKCGTPLKRMLPHRVDIAINFPIGDCRCWHGIKLAQTTLRMTTKQRMALSYEEQEQLRCYHIKAARNFALNRDVSQFEKLRLTAGK